jgi:hypothetical protein
MFSVTMAIHFGMIAAHGDREECRSFDEPHR